ncbi:MAG: hypothetical protein ACYSUD_05410 [Planctomycetota bacterium]
MSERINGFTHKHIYASTTLPFVASAAIQAPMNLSVLAWIAFVPFIIVCCRQTRPRRLFLIAYLISLLYWMGNLYWIFPVTIVGGITVCLYTALLWPVLAFCLRYCRAKKVPLFLASRRCSSSASSECRACSWAASSGGSSHTASIKTSRSFK